MIYMKPSCGHCSHADTHSPLAHFCRQELEERLANTNFFREPPALFMAPELAELVTRNMTVGRPRGLPAYSGPTEEEEEEDEAVRLCFSSLA